MLRRLVLVVVLTSAVGGFLIAPISGTSVLHATPTRWLSYGHDAQLTNFVRLSGLTPTTARRLRMTWSKTLDGAILASPLYANGTLFVETEVGSLYALRPSDGATRWRRTFGIVTTQTCGTWGLTSTGAIDGQRHVLYAISADGLMHAVSLATGKERAGWPVPITKAHADGEYVWGGLRLLGNTLYVQVASYCDAAGSDGHFANGRLVAVDVRRARVAATFDPVPGDDNLGGIWSWGGVSVDPSGKTLYTGIGNSRVWDPACSCFTETAGLGDSMVKLTSRLRLLGRFRPKGFRDDLHDLDLDFGSSPLLFRPKGCQPLAAANNKDGGMYVWSRNRLSRGLRQRFQLGDGVAAFVGQPAYAPPLRMLFESHVVDMRRGKKIGIEAFSVSSHCQLHSRWLTSVGEGQMPPPLVIGGVVFAAGGESGGYSALEARSGKLLWHFATRSSTLGPAIAAGSRIFGGDLAGTLRAFAPR